MTTLSAWIEGISLHAPGLAGWDAAAPRLAGALPLQGATTEIPKLAVLPPAERRRVGAVVRLALATGLEACASAAAEPSTLPTVFASSGGDGANCHAICETLASDDRLISPIRFHNSVNNAASGYWGIATGAMAPSAIVSAFDGSFAAGLLEALCQLATPGETEGRILLVSYDVPYPEPLHRSRPMSDACGVGLVLAAARGPAARARLEATPGPARPQPPMDGDLEQIRLGSPSGRALPLLQAVARSQAGEYMLEYHETLGLHVRVEPA